MSDLVERLRVYASDDHERLCQGRCYTCSCGYDDKRDPLMTEAADEIERLRAALSKARTVALEEAAKAVAYLRWQEVDPYDGRTLGNAVKAIRALIRTSS
jgi:hypothetical protein